jgi:hypothetical protein
MLGDDLKTVDGAEAAFSDKLKPVPEPEGG